MTSTPVRRRLRRAAGKVAKQISNELSDQVNGQAIVQPQLPYPDFSLREAETITATEGVEQQLAICAVDVMSSPAPFVTVGVRVDQVARALLGTNFTVVAVIDAGGYLVGTVSEDAVADFMLTHLWAQTVSVGNTALVADLTSELTYFTERLDTVGLDTPLAEIIETMVQLRCYTLLVVRSRRPVGIVCWHDILTCTTKLNDLSAPIPGNLVQFVGDDLV